MLPLTPILTPAKHPFQLTNDQEGDDADNVDELDTAGTEQTHLAHYT